MLEVLEKDLKEWLFFDRVKVVDRRGKFYCYLIIFFLCIKINEGFGV